jgi:hypothetical protein
MLCGKLGPKQSLPTGRGLTGIVGQVHPLHWGPPWQGGCWWWRGVRPPRCAAWPASTCGTAMLSAAPCHPPPHPPSPCPAPHPRDECGPYVWWAWPGCRRRVAGWGLSHMLGPHLHNALCERHAGVRVDAGCMGHGMCLSTWSCKLWGEKPTCGDGLVVCAGRYAAAPPCGSSGTSHRTFCAAFTSQQPTAVSTPGGRVPAELGMANHVQLLWTSP